MADPITMTKDEWLAKGELLFGANKRHWRFICPSCETVASVQDWLAAGAPETACAFSCIGRWKGARIDAFKGGPGPCNYAGGGLFCINPVYVDDTRVFEFAVPFYVTNGSLDDFHVADGTAKVMHDGGTVPALCGLDVLVDGYAIVDKSEISPICRCCDEMLAARVAERSAHAG